ncbi:hypothetical protein PALB_3130 [Pseudoalteromonas luteoviolacea B = ATCC 29581]|nr:hypothetical protein PALB_3130 [Pseudoalteromonas luteoviolacea B = ATCC 29581]
MTKWTLLFSCLLTFAASSLAQSEQSDTENTAQTETSQEASLSQNAYITDNLYIFMHSGSSKDYRILGSINAGTPVQIVGEEENGFLNIIDDKGREGWVEAEFITTEPGIILQNKRLQKQVSDLNQALQESRNNLPPLQTQLDELSFENETLKSKIEELEQLRAKRLASNQETQQQEQHLLLTYGAGIGFAGLLIGILLTLFLSRRKRYDGWA